MNALIVPQHVIQSIGWTLIHSLWQGLLIFVLLKIAVKIFPKADVRYGLGVGALALIIASSVITFITLNQSPASGQSFSFVLSASTAQAVEQAPASFASFFNWIDTNIIWFIRFWMLGFVIGMIRIGAGLLYINRLRKHSHPVADEWAQMVNNLSQSLNIKRVVAMAEAGITSPIVVGFMKPMILFPFGLLAGLTPEQVETILVHELSHIRRQDYLINLFQAVLETIFFFNPFVLLISSLIREERENCCDDMVIAKGINPMSYVRTLAQLEASRSSSTLALGISGNKNQLLNRIKRIMENSAKNDWGKGRLVPVALIVLGLICASWLSIGSEAESKVSNRIKHNALAADTSKEDGLKVIKRGKRTYFDEPVAPIEAIPEIEFVPDMNEHFDGFEAFEAPVPDFDMDIPEMPMIEMEGFAEAMEALAALEAAPQIDGIPQIDPLEYDIAWRYDSIPGFTFRGNAEEWANFEKDFTLKFKEQFKDFYEKNHEQLDKLMEEMRKNHEREAAEVVDLDRLRNAGQDAYIMRKLDAERWQLKNQANPYVYVPSPLPNPPNIDAFKLSPDKMARLEDQLATLESLKAMQFDFNDEPFRVMGEKMLEQQDFLQEIARQADDYNRDLKQMLREDGYLGKDEDIKQLNIQDNGGDLTINGKKIKEKDQLKYRALHDKYFAPRYKREGRRSE